MAYAVVERTPTDFFIGLFLAITSCFFIGASFIIKKKGLLRVSSAGNLRASAGGFGYLKDWAWWAGLLTMGIGEGANFAAYAFAPATLVTPLGALSILVSALLATKFLDERLNLIGKLGCFLVILGSVIIVIHAPKEGEINSSEELQKKIIESGFIYYVVLVAVVAIFMIRFTATRYGSTNVFVYVFICSIIGSLSVMCCKGLGLVVRESFSVQIGNASASFSYGLFFTFLFSLVFCISVQMVYLNKALDVFPTAIVNPVHYVLFTSCVILASSILFQELGQVELVDSIGTLVGFSVVIVALFMMNSFRNLQLSLADLYFAKIDKNGMTLP